jgi:putative phosphoesterase
LKLAILSDTHDNLQNVQFARLHVLAEDVDAVIHCGDLTEVEILDYFGDFKIFCAYGNGDFAEEVEERLLWLSKTNQVGHELDFSLEGKRIYLTHGHLYNHLEQAIASGSFD